MSGGAFLKKRLVAESPGSLERDRVQGEKRFLISNIGNIRSVEISDTEIITKAMFARQ